MNWVPNEMFSSNQGKFEYRDRSGNFARLLKIQASGYLPVESRDIKSDEGKIELTFELKRAKQIELSIRTPQDQPAIGAKVALGIAGAQIAIRNGDFDASSTYAQQVMTDESGKLRFPAQASDFLFVILHPEGFASIGTDRLEGVDTVKLTPWAKLEGTFHIGSDTPAGINIDIISSLIESYGENRAHVYSSNNIVTGPNGRFSLDRVFPGYNYVRRQIIRMVNEGATEVTSTPTLPVFVNPGESKVIQIGGKGARVVGQLIPPSWIKEKIVWSFADVDVEPVIVPPPELPVPPAIANDRQKRSEWYNQFITTAEGILWRQAAERFEQERRLLTRFSATVDREGRFAIDDVPADSYRLSVRFYEKTTNVFIRDVEFRFDDASIAEEKEVDLGELQLLTR